MSEIITSNPMPANFTQLVTFLKKFGLSDVKTVVEIGARDCKESIIFESAFSAAQIFSCECNPRMLPECRQRVENHPRITLIEKAISETEGPVSFFPINQEKTVTKWKDGNPGASSLLVASNKYPVETYVQDKVTVESTTLGSLIRTHHLETIDLLWMDIQGAELMALRGAGTDISRIRVIHTEVEFFEIYKDQPLFRDIKKYLNAQGFLCVGFTAFGQYSGDAVFIHTSELSSVFMAYIQNTLLFPAKSLRVKLSKIKNTIYNYASQR